MKQTILMLALAVAIVGAPRAWSEEPVAPQAASKADERVTEIIKLQHVPASLMARQITPRKPEAQPKSKPRLIYKKGNMTMVRPATPQDAIDDAAGKGAPEIDAATQAMLAASAATEALLYAGIERITPNEARRELWVRGTPASIQKLREMVAIFDKPLRRVEVEVHFIRLAEADLRPLLQPGQDEPPGFSASDTPGVLRANQALRNSTPNFEALLAGGRAKSVLLQRAPVINNTPMHARAGVSLEAGPDDLQIEAIPTLLDDKTVTMEVRARAGGQSLKSFDLMDEHEAFAVLLPPREVANFPESAWLTVALIRARVLRDRKA